MPENVFQMILTRILAVLDQIHTTVWEVRRGKGMFAPVLHEQAGTSHTVVSDQTPSLLSEGENRQAKRW